MYSDGCQTRSFCYIDDLIEGIVKAMNSTDGEIFNLGNSEEYTIIELAEKVQEIVDTESEITFHELPDEDPSRRKPDISKARKQLGWNPETSLEEGLCKTVEHFKDQEPVLTESLD